MLCVLFIQVHHFISMLLSMFTFLYPYCLSMPIHSYHFCPSKFNPFISMLIIYDYPLISTLFICVSPFISCSVSIHNLSYPPWYLIRFFWLACSANSPAHQVNQLKCTVYFSGPRYLWPSERHRFARHVFRKAGAGLQTAAEKNTVKEGLGGGLDPNMWGLAALPFILIDNHAVHPDLSFHIHVYRTCYPRFLSIFIPSW